MGGNDDLRAGDVILAVSSLRLVLIIITYCNPELDGINNKTFQIYRVNLFL